MSQTSWVYIYGKRISINEFDRWIFGFDILLHIRALLSDCQSNRKQACLSVCASCVETLVRPTLLWFVHDICLDWDRIDIFIPRIPFAKVRFGLQCPCNIRVWRQTALFGMYYDTNTLWLWSVFFFGYKQHVFAVTLWSVNSNRGSVEHDKFEFLKNKIYLFLLLYFYWRTLNFLSWIIFIITQKYIILLSYRLNQKSYRVTHDKLYHNLHRP